MIAADFARWHDWAARMAPVELERAPDGDLVMVWKRTMIDGPDVSHQERELARQARQRWKRDELTPDEADAELGRWLHTLALLKGDLNAHDVSEWDETTIRDGIAHAEAMVETYTRQLRRFLRGGVTTRRGLKADFEAIRYVDLVGLAETLTGNPAVRSGQGRYRIRCPFHDDNTPSLVIYPPGGGWWCPVCHKGGQDAASFCAEFFDCTQVEGLHWVETLAVGVRGAT